MVFENVAKLETELKAAGIDVISVRSTGEILDSNNDEIQDQPAVLAVINAHDPIDYEQQREQAAEGNASQIAGWSDWTEAEAMAWIDSNLVPELAGNAPKTLTAIRSLARLVIALRDGTMPGLRGQQADD